MNLNSSSLPWTLAVAACASLLSTTAEARDRIRIPLPPPPSEVFDEVRDVIHSIGRGIKRVGSRIVEEVEIVEYRGHHPDVEYGPEYRPRGPVHPRHPISDEDVEWDGEFYPDEYDSPEVRRNFPPREDLSPEEHARWEEQLRREEEYLRQEEYRRNAERRKFEGPVRDYDEEYDIEPTPPPPQVRRPSHPDGFDVPTPPPTYSPGGIKETGPVSTPPAENPPPAPAPAPSRAPSTRREPAAPPSAPTSTPPPPASSKPTSPSQVPYGEPVPGKKGLVYPPGATKSEGNMVDVSDFQPGQLVRDPKTGILFRVP